jgi:hypothetical protein
VARLKIRLPGQPGQARTSDNLSDDILPQTDRTCVFRHVRLSGCPELLRAVKGNIATNNLVAAASISSVLLGRWAAHPNGLPICMELCLRRNRYERSQSAPLQGMRSGRVPC